MNHYEMTPGAVLGTANTWEANQTIADNVLLLIGTTGDGVIVLNTAGLAADAELTSVIEGTSDHQGTAANSLILSNVTNDGDILMLVSDGGNSKEFLLANADTADLQLGHGMATMTLKTASGDLDLNPGGNIVANSNSITEIGNAGSQLLADAWTMTSANAQNLLIETTGAAISSVATFKIPASGTGNVQLFFTQGAGTGAADNDKYMLFYGGTAGEFGLYSFSALGAGAQGYIWSVQDTTDDVKFYGGISTDGSSSPTSGIVANGVISQDDTTNSTSATTGSIHTDGGVGIAENLYLAKAINTPDGMGADGEQLTSGGDNVAMDWAAAGSLLEYKQGIRPLDIDDALDRMINTRAILYHYRPETEAGDHAITTGDYETEYAGVDGREFPEVMHHNGKIFSEGSAFGYTVASFQAMNKKVEKLERQLRKAGIALED